MTKELFQTGGPFKIQKTGVTKHIFEIPLQSDQSGRIARECKNPECSPAYFKVKNGTGITEKQEIVFCPYCRREAEPGDFFTQEQIRFGKEIVLGEVHKGIQEMIKGTINSIENKSSGSSIKLSFTPGSSPNIRRPFEEEVLRAVICPHCGLDHAVFGLAIWCSDCGNDIFMTHVGAELNVIRTILGDVERRKQELGPRIAAKDLENCLEDTVSIFEAVLKTILIRFLNNNEESEANIQSVINKIRNKLQNPEMAVEIIRNYLKLDLFEGLPPETSKSLCELFCKRNPITHNLGVIDRKYIEKALATDKEGKEIRVSKQEIEEAMNLCMKVFTSLHERAFHSHSSTKDNNL